jgi:hypothetical protein
VTWSKIEYYKRKKMQGGNGISSIKIPKEQKNKQKREKIEKRRKLRGRGKTNKCNSDDIFTFKLATLCSIL